MKPWQSSLLVVWVSTVLLTACSGGSPVVATHQLSSTTQTTTTITTTTVTPTVEDLPVEEEEPTSLTSTAEKATALNLISNSSTENDREMVRLLLTGFTGQTPEYIRAHLSFVRETGTIYCDSWDDREFQGESPTEPPIIWCYSAQRFYLLPVSFKRMRQQNEVLAAGYALFVAAHYALGDNHAQPVQNNMPKVAELAGHIARNLECASQLNATQVQTMSKVFGFEEPIFQQAYNGACV